MRQIRRLSENEERKMVKEYIQGASINTLMIKYGFASGKSITDKVKKYHKDDYKQKIQEAKSNRKNYHIDMKQIDCEFNAYFIGLMLTDGYIQDHNRFGIQLTDEDCIHFISKVTNKEYKAYKTQNENHKPYYRIIFSDKEQINFMKRYGIVRNKSKIIPAPILKTDEEKFIPYIIRGIIDGDGCLYYTSGNTPAFSIFTASLDFAKWIRDVLENKLYMKDLRMTTIEQKYYRVESSYYPNLVILRALVYDKPFGMQRKYELLRKMLRDYNGECLSA